MNRHEGPPSIEWITQSPPVARVFGDTLRALFEYAAEAMFAATYDLASIPPTYSRPIVSSGDTFDELLLNWLEELRFVSEHDGLTWSWFVVDRLEEGGVQGSAGGLYTSDVDTIFTRVTDVLYRGNGIVAVPEGYWTELEFTLGPAITAV